MAVVIACADLENESLGDVSMDTCVYNLGRGEGGGSELLFLVFLLYGNFIISLSFHLEPRMQRSFVFRIVELIVKVRVVHLAIGTMYMYLNCPRSQNQFPKWRSSGVNQII